MGEAKTRKAMPSPPGTLAPGRVEALLAACWLLVPAIQYLITVQITAARLGHPTALFPLAWSAVIVYDDLTPFYLVLAAATVAVVVARVVARRVSRP